MPDDLQILTVPLQGSRLIEASAGTGKTWTIAALYVRLVAGVACVPRLPANILVMTFTKAATRELSDRIRQRLTEAADHLRGSASRGNPGRVDAFLDDVRDHFAEGSPREQAAWYLAQAAQAMDEASVHTIDAWCQRVLRDFAFDSGSPFEEELQANERHIQTQALHDYWRTQVYPLRGATLDAVLSVWKSVDALHKSVKDLLNKRLPAAKVGESLADLAHARLEDLAALKRAASSLADDWVDAAEALRQQAGPANVKGLPTIANVKRWAQDVHEWAQSDAVEALALTDTAWKRLSGRELAAALGMAEEAMPETFRHMDRLAEALDTWRAGNALRVHAALDIAETMAAIKSRAGQFGFADMLARLDRALDESVNADRARRLRERILERYPVALIDEFQDTSPVQLRIFDRLYRIADNDPARTLLLIGDPKQAIYKFRGADIYSYLQARRATNGRHEVLGTNFRSTQGVVKAVNTLFEHAEKRFDGAFLYGCGSDGSQMPFHAVQAQGRTEELVTASGPLAPLTVLVDEVLRTSDEAQRLYAAHCAEQIVHLLNDEQAGFQATGKPFQRLRPSDIAILVRTGFEAQTVRRQLQRRGVASVYLSEKDSVFESPEAVDLLRLMQAVMEPGNIRLARTALATALMGWTLEQLVHLADDDEAFDRQCDRLRQLHAVWVAQGILAMIRRAVLDFDWPARWAAQAIGDTSVERRLTNVLHLGELLQAASAQVKGEQALWRWLQQQVFDDDDASVSGEEAQLRLESDAGLVRVVTIHKSKGLEYPVVFLPFAAHHRDIAGPGKNVKAMVFELPDASGSGLDPSGGAGVHTVLTPTKTELEQETLEQLREQIRLLYVAVTRARHAVWVGAAHIAKGGKAKTPTSAWHLSALGVLVSGREEISADKRRADWEYLAERRSEMQLTWMPASTEGPPWPGVTALQAPGQAASLAPAKVYTASFDRHWAVSSYSGLVKQLPGAMVWQTDVVTRTTLRDDEPAREDTLPSRATDGLLLAPHAGDRISTGADPSSCESNSVWHAFPKGASAGNFLHELLESLADEQFRVEDGDEWVAQVQGRCERSEFKDQGPVVVSWLRALCSTPLPPVGASLSQLVTVAPEMEFWLPSDDLPVGQLDQLCRAHILSGQIRQPLNQQVLRGMFMGFADLVFEHEGRYWVLDYKSNHLGTRDADYTAAAMGRAMLQHRYDVQAAIYLLALHRLLRARLGAAYAPGQHLGGALYVFMRGIAGAQAGCFHVSATPTWIDALDALLTPMPRGAPMAENT